MNDLAPIKSADVESDLQKFLDGLASQEHLETSTVAQLSQIKFHVKYADKKPAQTEIDGFAVNDFPIYLLTKIPPGSSSGADIRSLVCSHKIPNLVRLAKRVGDSQISSSQFVHDTIANSWDDKPDVLGYGMSADYFAQNNQQICRKLGIIKMRGSLSEKRAGAVLRQRLASVLKHEMGHMFGMDHEADTLMDSDYDNIKKTSYEPDQLWIMGRALEALLHS